jgi:hypothetical protein
MRELIKNKGYNKILLCLSYNAWTKILKHYSLKLFCLTYCQSNWSDFGVYKLYFGLNAILPNWLRMLLDH